MSRYSEAYIYGYMNINVLQIGENHSYNLLYVNLTLHSFMLLITLLTRLLDTCDTLIDNIFLLIILTNIIQTVF